MNVTNRILTDADVQPLFLGSYTMPVAPQIEALYSDPRVADIKDWDPFKPIPGRRDERRLPPKKPPVNGASRFLLLAPCYYAWD